MTNSAPMSTAARVYAFLIGAMGMALVALSGPALASAAVELKGFAYETTEADGSTELQSSAHPDQTIATFAFATDEQGVPREAPKDVSVDLPLGAVGSPASIPTCTDVKLLLQACPPESQIGITQLGFENLGTKLDTILRIPVPVYNLEAPPGVLAQFGFLTAAGVVIHLTATVHSLPEYGITITTRAIPQPLPYFEIINTFWGVPAAASHDEDRGVCASTPHGSGCKVPSEADEVPFLTNPSACSDTSQAVARVNSWLVPETVVEAMAGNVEADKPFGVSGCAASDFSPSITVHPSTEATDSPTGLHINIHLPQTDDPNVPAEAQLRDATVAFPDGFTINPASGAGLEACSPSQVGLTTSVGNQNSHFNQASITCPDAAKLGTVQINTPLIAQPLQGAIYLAQPYQNPFGSLVGLYIVVEDPQTGVNIKIAGKADLDPQTGRITTVFPNNPQLPFEDLDVNLFKGSRAALRTPLSCGTQRSESTLVPWSAPEGPERHPSDNVQINSGANGGVCPGSGSAAPNSPTLAAGTVNPAAGAYSPFRLKVTRRDGSQPIRRLEATLPTGLLGRLAGIPYCSDASLIEAASRSGREQLVSPSCPAASKVGSVSVGAGAGPTPLYVGGNAYLAGPYKGAPVSLAIVTPAVAGPFDLGTVVVRTALNIDPETTQIRAVSDPIPAILQGIPLDLRSISVQLDRPRFTLNPTHCDGGAIDVTTISIFDQSASLSSPFAAGGCKSLKFKPKLALHLKGGTKRAKYPALTATLRPRPGDANIAKAVVSLPHSEFLAQEHIGTICTRVQFAADACPKRSIYGRATALSPLLDKPLSGPVYLRSSNHQLPDLVADLNGQIRVTLDGRIDTGSNGGLRTSFEMVPDAPVSKFVLKMPGGKKSLLRNSRNLCKTTNRASVQLDGQNGKIRDFKPIVTNSCKKKKHKAKRHKHR